MTTYRLFLGTLLVITGLNLCLFIAQRTNRAVSPAGESDSSSLQASQVRFDSVHQLLRNINDDRIFVLEPFLLAQMLGSEKLNDLKWRFDLPELKLNRGSLTLAMFGHQMASLDDKKELTEVARIDGPLPFTNRTVVHHLFYHWHDLKVHVVVLHQVKHFLWIGQIPQPQMEALRGFNIHFGKNEEIYDSFGLNMIESIQYPDEIYHFLSQSRTSRYIPCPSKSHNWLRKHNIKYNQTRVDISIESIVSIKALMKELKMEFWAMCGTLLGWYRQCSVIPFTTDSDFSTWPKYLQGEDISHHLLKTAPKHNLRLFYRFGEPWHSMEYSFKTKNDRDKVDMFFTYRNSTHFLLPFHIAWKHVYQYSFYPKYDLCSIELLGYKLLAPCQAEQVIVTEYGPNWDRPKENYDYAESPFNSGPKYPFPRNISQYTQY